MAQKEQLENRVNKQLMTIVDERQRTALARRAKDELRVIEHLKLYPLMKGKAKVPVPIERVILDESLSVVGCLLGRLGEVAQEPLDLEEFLVRNQKARDSKLGALNNTQITELVLAGAFGDPAVAMEKLWEKVPPKKREKYNYRRELSLRLYDVARMSQEEAYAIVKAPVSSFEDYIHPLTSGKYVGIVGQLTLAPKKFNTKHGPAARLEVYPSVVEGQYEEPRVHVVIWPRGMAKLRAVKPQPSDGDLVYVAGVRDYNTFHGHPQLAIAEAGEVRVL